MLKQYEYVCAVAQAESISAAAEQLGLAQSALSRYILKLEESLGQPLFDRSVVPLRLTEAGQCYVAAGKRILDQERQLEKQLAELQAVRGSLIRLGMGASRAPVLLPQMLAAFQQTHPQVQVHTEECPTAQLAEKLQTGALDLVISFSDLTTAGFGMEPLFEERVDLAVPARFAAQCAAAQQADGAVRLDQLAVPMISLLPGQQLRNVFDQLTGGKIAPAYTAEYLQTAMALVSAGLGAALAPSYWRATEAPDAPVRYFPVAMPEMLAPQTRVQLLAVLQRNVCVFYHKEQYLSEAERALIACAKTVCVSFNLTT